MATHDAERFVRASLRSILSLDYPDLQILINDNGSSDKTLDIVRAETQGDDRVTVTAWPDNRGAAANFNFLAGRAEGEYFFWASDHDAWHAAFVRRLVDALESDSDAVLAYPRTMLVDLEGNEQGLMDDYVDVSAHDPVARYRSLVWHLTICNMAYGLMRTTVLQGTWGVLPIIGPDHLLLAQMALRGRFIRVEETLFYRRENRRVPESETARMSRPAYSRAWQRWPTADRRCHALSRTQRRTPTTRADGIARSRSCARESEYAPCLPCKVRCQRPDCGRGVDGHPVGTRRQELDQASNAHMSGH